MDKALDILLNKKIYKKIDLKIIQTKTNIKQKVSLINKIMHKTTISITV
jgi:hypothetical protein